MKFKKEVAGMYSTNINGEKVFIEKIRSDYGEVVWIISGEKCFSEFDDFDPSLTLREAKETLKTYLERNTVPRESKAPKSLKRAQAKAKRDAANADRFTQKFRVDCPDKGLFSQGYFTEDGENLQDAATNWLRAYFQDFVATPNVEYRDDACLVMEFYGYVFEFCR